MCVASIGRLTQHGGSGLASAGYPHPCAKGWPACVLWLVASTYLISTGDMFVAFDEAALMRMVLSVGLSAGVSSLSAGCWFS